MDTQLESLSLEEPIKFHIETYTVETKTGQDFQIDLPLPSELNELISRNIQKEQILVEMNKLLSIHKPKKIIDLTSNDKVENIIILKSICAFLGSINSCNDFSQITGEDSLSTINDSQFIENCPNFFSYIERNKPWLFFEFKMKDFDVFIDALINIGIKVLKNTLLYETMRNYIMARNKIMIIIAPSNNFWIKSERVTIGGKNYDKKINNYQNIFFNLPFVKKFIQKIINHPRCYLGFINSMMHKNLRGTIDALKVELSDFPSEFALFDQTIHINTNPNPKEKPVFVRDMTKITHVLKNVCKKTEFSESNILILESEADKINNTKDNTVIMNLFSEQYLEYSNEEKELFSKKQDEIIEYVEKLLNECSNDIREYIVANPLNKEFFSI